MKEFFSSLLKSAGFLGFFAIIIYLLFHPKHWWKTWIIVIGLYVIGSYGKAYHEEHKHDNYDHTPGSVLWKENIKNYH